MYKKLFFLTGLPRAGNTLFASVMNQNPKIAVTANSITPDILWQTQKLKTNETFKVFPDERSMDNVLSNVLPNYYSHWKKDYIIDRSVWGIPDNLEMIKKYVKNEIKIIVLTRNILEVLASFILFSRKSKDNFVLNSGRTDEERCDFLLSYNSQLSRSILSVHELSKPENRQYAHFIDYEDMMINPNKEINGVYEFLDIPKFDHKFTNLSQLNNNGIEYDDSIIGSGLHTVKTDKVEKSKYNMYNILPDSIVRKYSKMEIMV